MWYDERKPLAASLPKWRHSGEGEHTEAAKAPDPRTRSLFVLAVLPSFFFVCTVWMFYFLYSASPRSTFAVSALVLVMCVAFSRDKRRKTETAPRPWPRAWRLSALSVLAGVSVSMIMYFSFIVFYDAYVDMKEYTNVVGSASAAQYSDAGVLVFSSETSIDTSKAVGYRSAALGQTVCVAPIIDTNMADSDAINFYAIGLDCCEWRAQFECHDSADADARTGMLLLYPETLVSQLMAWTVEDALNRTQYDDAISLQAAVYDTTVAEDTRLVYWTKDADTFRNGYKKNAAVYAAIISFGFVVLCFIGAALHVYEFKHLQ
mmetsp:Transcript_162/g.585  ORF Transcript_162/g.585 Transcript_162/m.585 type:complete len:319 (-) Transcript_162:242-1198(-)